MIPRRFSIFILAYEMVAIPPQVQTSPPAGVGNLICRLVFFPRKGLPLTAARRAGNRH